MRFLFTVLKIGLSYIYLFWWIEVITWWENIILLHTSPSLTYFFSKQRDLNFYVISLRVIKIQNSTLSNNRVDRWCYCVWNNIHTWCAYIAHLWIVFSFFCFLKPSVMYKYSTSHVCMLHIARLVTSSYLFQLRYMTPRMGSGSGLKITLHSDRSKSTNASMTEIDKWLN